MMNKMLERKDALKMMKPYEKDLRNQDLSERTIKKYIADVEQWIRSSGKIIRKKEIVEYKKYLGSNYAATSTISKMTSINRYLKWLDYPELTVRMEKMQKPSLHNIISRDDYAKMIRYAQVMGNRKMYLIMKTITKTGIRIGELKYITVEAAQKGTAEVYNKGKYRQIFLAEQLCLELLDYCRDLQYETGVIFHGKTRGVGITPGAVWKAMKKIGERTGVSRSVVYPHALRHLFAREYMKKSGDIWELAELLGHSRLETTWIYTRTSAEEKRAKLNLLEI